MFTRHTSGGLIPGPDLACQDAVMESEAFISSENSCISTSRRARAGWHAMDSFQCFGLDTRKAIASRTNYVAPGQAYLPAILLAG